jgi:hypothetical protein
MWSSRRWSREIEHLGSAHDEAELEALKAVAQQRIAARQRELDLGLEPAGGGPLPITSSRMAHLLREHPHHDGHPTRPGQRHLRRPRRAARP